ncbi:putative choline transporter, neither null mutation nor overexpression affects choline transport [Boothiomyces macroporosus]|uniref:Protein PNS1 n=1 Tax=Boothiomyces macroporosus TaxID=261099 RepID=A0AAD5UN77_9FUNG|nr:putative choline transporter, neither null mutation nor overexpression affects choline transport [Boothiomyces macroporosus]
MQKRPSEVENGFNKRLKESDDHDDPEDELVKFQKKAILVQMKEYKRLYEDSLHEQTLLKEELKRRDNTNNQYVKYWGMVRRILTQIEHLLSVQSLSNLESSFAAIQNALKSKEIPIYEKEVNLAGQVVNVNKISLLKSQVNSLKSNISDLETRLEASTVELQIAYKKIDRLKIIGAPVAKPEPVVEEKKVKPSEDVNDEKYQEALATASARLNEIQVVLNEKLELENEINKLVLELSEERHQSSASKEIEKELRAQLDQFDITRDRLDQTLLEVEALQSQRRTFIEQIRTDEEKRRKIMEADLKKSESEMARLRIARDNLQKNLDAQLAKEAADSKTKEDIKALSEARKSRIIGLESELARLKMHIASEIGEPSLIAFFNENPDANPYSAAQEEISRLNSKIKQLEKTIDSMPNSVDANIKQLNIVEEELVEKTKELEKYIQLVGPLDSNIESSMSAKLQQKEQELNNIKQKFDYYQKSEQRLISELEALGKAWSKLEEQNSKRKSRLEQKVSLMTKQTTTQSNMTIAQKRQSEKQLEQIRKLEELEKNLSLQLSTIERELALVNPNLEAEKRKYNNLNIQMAELRDSYSALKIKYDSLVSILNEKTEQTEAAKNQVKRAQEQVTVLKRKLSKNETGSDIQNERDQYRLLLMCQSCNNNFKSHTLLKCMHTFCKDCIDVTYNSRQRKCPTCAVPFGLADVKQMHQTTSSNFNKNLQMYNPSQPPPVYFPSPTQPYFQQQQAQWQPPKKESRFQQTSIKDVWATISWLIAMFGFAILSIFAYTQLQNNASRQGGNYDTSRLSGLFFTTAVTGAVLCFVFFLALQKFAGTLIKVTFLLSIFAYLTLALISFVYGGIIQGIFCVLAAGVTYWIYNSWRFRIPFTKILLNTVTTVTAKYYGMIVSGAVGLCFQMLFTFWWAMTLVGLTVANQQQSLSSGALNFFYVYSIFIFYWCSQVISNCVHAICCGTFATFYFNGIKDSAGNIFVPFENPTIRSAKRLITTSFGSVCYGSLLIAALQTVKLVVDQKRSDDRRNIFSGFILCLLSCILTVFGDILEYMNTYAFVQVAVYGKEYCQAAKDTWHLAKSRGVDALINDCLVGRVLVLGGILVGICNAICGVIYLAATQSNRVGGANFAVGGLFAFVVGIFQFYVVANVLHSGVVTSFVCLAEDPQALLATKPELYYKIREVNSKAKPRKGGEFNDFQYWSPPISKIDIDEPEESSKVDFSHWKSAYPTLKPYKQAESKKSAPKVDEMKLEPSALPKESVSVKNTVVQNITPITQNNTTAIVNNTVNNNNSAETRVTNNYIAVQPVKIAELAPNVSHKEERPPVAVRNTPINVIHTVIVNNNVHHVQQPPYYPPHTNNYHSQPVHQPRNVYNAQYGTTGTQIASNYSRDSQASYMNQHRNTNIDMVNGAIGDRRENNGSKAGTQYNSPPSNIRQIIEEPKRSSYHERPLVESRSLTNISAQRTSESGTVRSDIRQSSARKETTVELGNETVNPSSMTLSSPVEEKLQSHINEKTPWWRIVQVLRSVTFLIYTYITVFRVLNEPDVSVVGAEPLYISILVLSGVDIRYIASVWALIADHELLVDIIPLIANFIVRIYSYRLSEVLTDPNAANTLEKTDINIQDWANPKYHNYILLLLWGLSALITIIFHAAHRCYYIGFQHQAPALAITLTLKALLFAFDLYSNGLFLYIFLVSLGTKLFESTLYMSLLLTAISLSPIVSNISNSLINIPLLYYYERLDKQYSRSTLLKKAFEKVFSPITTLMVLLAVFYSCVMIYLLVQLQILSPTSPGDLIRWNPQSWITFMVGVNLLANYLIGIGFTLTYYTLRLVRLLGLQILNTAI